MKRARFGFSAIFTWIGVGVLWSVQVAQAEIYKWYDHNGQVHYSDTPPQDGKKHRDVSEDLPPIQVIEPPPKAPLSENKSPTSVRERSRAVSVGQSRRAAHVEDQCAAYRTALDRIQKQLRSGYKARAGERLRERRRELSDRLYRECRNRW